MKNSLFTGCLKVGICLFTVLGFEALGQPDGEKENPIELEAFEVVGSRMETVDMNTPSPVLVLGRESIEDLGYPTLGDIVRNLPFNSGSTIGIEGAATGFSSGVSSINLRGLGNNNTLVLINGRRSSPAGGSAFNGFQTVFDFKFEGSEKHEIQPQSWIPQTKKGRGKRLGATAA